MEERLLTDERRRVIHGLLQERMAAVLADLVATAPATPLGCTGCGQRVPAVMVTLRDGELRCQHCSEADVQADDETMLLVSGAHAALSAR
jgi:hypothetical protein